MRTLLEVIEELNKNDLKEALSDFSNLPVQPLPVNAVKDYIRNIPAARMGRPPQLFKLGYAKELGREIASKYRGGRGSDGQPRVRIIKCTEYSKLYTGVAWTSTNSTKKADSLLGTERHTGERTGFNFADSEEEMINRIGKYANGIEALQAYIADGSVQKTKYFISLNGEPLEEISKQEVAKYLVDSAARGILNGTERKSSGTDAEGNAVYDKPINRFLLEGIYMIGNLGRSIM